MKLKNYFVKVLKYGSCIYLVKKLAFSVVICCGESMEPVIKDGDIVFVNQFSLRASGYNPEVIKDRVVILDSPIDPRTVLCKRVTATSNDNSIFKSIPKGYIYILGDNRKNSHDSEDFGPVPIGLVRGIVVYKIHPEFKKIE